MRAYALVAGLVAAVIACGQTTPSPPTQHLVFTGPAAGTLTDATTQCLVFAAQAQANYHFDGRLGGQPLSLNIQIHSGYKGAGTYPVGTLLDGAGELRLQIGDYVGSSTTGAGTVTFDPGQKTGSVDAQLSQGEQVKGTFACASVGSVSFP